MPADLNEVTVLLKAMHDGEPDAADRLLPLVYAELHRLARGYMRRERGDHTLQPTALINEAFMRLASNERDYENRQHFIAVAATVMRRVLVDHARAHAAQMRGGELQRVEFEDQYASGDGRPVDVLAVDQALDRLQAIEPRQARIVELRYFAGLTVEEIAALLNIAVRTVKRDWALARVWLHTELAARAPSA